LHLIAYCCANAKGENDVGFNDMKRNILIVVCVLIAAYAFLALPNLLEFFAAVRLDSGMTYQEFARPFKVIDASWTEKQVVATFGEPDKTEVGNGVRRLTYEWHDFEFTWYLAAPIYQGGGVNVHFRDGTMVGTGWSDNVPDEEQSQPSAEPYK